MKQSEIQSALTVCARKGKWLTLIKEGRLLGCDEKPEVGEIIKPPDFSQKDDDGITIQAEC